MAESVSVQFHCQQHTMLVCTLDSCMTNQINLLQAMILISGCKDLVVQHVFSEHETKSEYVLELAPVGSWVCTVQLVQISVQFVCVPHKRPVSKHTILMCTLNSYMVLFAKWSHSVSSYDFLSLGIGRPAWFSEHEIKSECVINVFRTCSCRVLIVYSSAC